MPADEVGALMADDVGAPLADDFGPQMGNDIAATAYNPVEGPSGAAEPAAPASAAALSERCALLQYILVFLSLFQKDAPDLRSQICDQASVYYIINLLHKRLHSRSSSNYKEDARYRGLRAFCRTRRLDACGYCSHVLECEDAETISCAGCELLWTLQWMWVPSSTSRLVGLPPPAHATRVGSPHCHWFTATLHSIFTHAYLQT